MRSATSGLTRPRLCRARSTVPRDTPASSAICCAVTAIFPPPLLFLLQQQYSTLHAFCKGVCGDDLCIFAHLQRCTSSLPAFQPTCPPKSTHMHAPLSDT